MGLLDGKTCVITGGAGSIGLATARLFLNEGARLTLVDRNAEALQKVGAQLDPARVITVAADVTNAADVRDYVTRTVDAWGNIDVLFSNAGNDGPIIPVVDYPEDLFDSIIATHIRGGFLACKYAIPRMNDGGSIILMSSITGVRGVAGNCSYVAAKHGVLGLARGIAREVANRRIRVNTVNPGPIDNEFMRTAERSMSQLLGRDAGEFFDELIPLGRHGLPDEVARAVLFLASDASSYTSGTALMVDGAMCA